MNEEGGAELRGLKIGFCNRERAIHQIVEFAEKGTWHPIVVFGPEGCGKTSWLRQALELLKGLGFSVIYFNPMRREFLAEMGIKSVEEEVSELLRRASSVNALAGFIGYLIDFAKEAIKLGKKKLAIIVDDAFQYVGVGGSLLRQRDVGDNRAPSGRLREGSRNRGHRRGHL